MSTSCPILSPCPLPILFYLLVHVSTSCPILSPCPLPILFYLLVHVSNFISLSMCPLPILFYLLVHVSNFISLSMCSLPILLCLGPGEWFTSRTSACGLFAVAYAKGTEQTKQDLRVLYKSLCGDDTPMVRRAAASKLGVSSLLGHFRVVKVRML